MESWQALMETTIVGFTPSRFQKSSKVVYRPRLPMEISCWRRSLAWGRLATATAAIATVLALPSSQTQAQVGRWLEVRQLSGGVTVQTDRNRNAWVGARLLQAGHSITTATGASSTLVADLNIGTVTLSQNTYLRVQRLAILSNGGRVTILQVSRGQARMRARAMNNPSSRLELHTPSGVASVRGTEFGVAVEANGKTNVATLEGRVAVQGEGQTVNVTPGLATVVRPGESPSPPQALDQVLDLTWVRQSRRGNTLEMVGQVDVANRLLWVQGTELVEVPVDRGGYFTAEVPLDGIHDTVTFVVSNAMGDSRQHEVLVTRVPRR
jgi:hypothetical protein